MKIKRNNQSLILAGESAEADRRFERAIRVNVDSVPASKPISRNWKELYRLVTAEKNDAPRDGVLETAD